MPEAPVIEPLGAATLNRDWRLEVDTGADPATPVWTVVRGRTDFTPTLDTTLQDDSDMDSDGYKSQTATAQAWSLTTKVVRKATKDVTPTYDPGQEALRLAAQELGPANSVHVRWYKLGAVRTEAYALLQYAYVVIIAEDDHARRALPATKFDQQFAGIHVG